jgi:hypothetical protein
MTKLLILSSVMILSGCAVVGPTQVAFFGFENNLALMKETSPVDSSAFISINQAFSTRNRSTLNNGKSQ